jgi:mono/diheme cytochrome c family protein
MVLLVLALPAVESRAADEAFFRDKVAALFERHCVSCHQGDKPKGGLSLVSAKQAHAGGESGPAIERGKPGESLLIEVISGEKPAMPKGSPPLTVEQVATIRQWIEQGGAWPDDLMLRDRKLAGAGDHWWSLTPLVRPPAPEVHSDWVRTPIDAFILAKLKTKGLTPSPEADRATLIRRLTYDLHGLPPTPEEVAAFLADSKPDAYERLIDRLLDSPRYGERWGRHWLDVVHYGESHGYDKDKPRPNAWPYRDYVIAAFNSDKPYGRFIEEQLAGDVLFPDDPQAMVATGFIAAGPWDFVGHAELREGTLDKKITRSNDRDDMVAASMSTFLSLTVHCARCHNHKFDPIPQEEYYRLQAVFAGIDRADRAFDANPETHRTRRALSSARKPLAAHKRTLAAKVAEITSPEIRETDQRAAELNRELKTLPKPDGTSSPTNGYHSAIEAKSEVVKWVQIDLGRSAPIDEIALVPARPTDFTDTPGFGFPVRFRVETSDDPQFAVAETIADHQAADLANPGDKPLAFKVQDREARYVRVTATRLWPRTNDYVFALAELQVISAGKNVALESKVTALDSIEGGRWGTKFLVDNHSSRAQLGEAKPASPESLRRKEIEAEIAKLTTQRRAAVDALIDAEMRTAIAAVDTQLAEIDKQIGALPAPQKVYAAANDFTPIGSFAPASVPRPVHLLYRGSDKTPGPEMTPGALSCFVGLPADFPIDNVADEGARRVALARWITDPQNPLARRSIVNRVWQYHFGRGIVDTPNDFGHKGELPTHPELLDWLAVEFGEQKIQDSGFGIQGTNGGQESGVRGQGKRGSTLADSPPPSDGATPPLRKGGQGGSRDPKSAAESQRGATPPNSPFLRGGAGGWSLKRLHKLILMSAVYRQSSAHNPACAAIDSGNQYLWRMNRQRLEAEAIRDAALAVSGKLDTTMGGPSLQQFFFKDDHSPIYDYERFDVDAPAANRRSVYRFIVRSVPDPFMECLDAADPSLLTPKRNATLTALQALSLLNNQFMVRQAEHFAQRLRAISDDPARQIEAAFRLAFGRAARAEETETLVDYTRRHGLENTCRVIFNSNEFVFVD